MDLRQKKDIIGFTNRLWQRLKWVCNNPPPRPKSRSKMRTRAHTVSCVEWQWPMGQKTRTRDTKVTVCGDLTRLQDSPHRSNSYDMRTKRYETPACNLFRLFSNHHHHHLCLNLHLFHMFCCLGGSESECKWMLFVTVSHLNHKRGHSMFSNFGFPISLWCGGRKSQPGDPKKYVMEEEPSFSFVWSLGVSEAEWKMLFVTVSHHNRKRGDSMFPILGFPFLSGVVEGRANPVTLKKMWWWLPSIGLPFTLGGSALSFYGGMWNIVVLQAGDSHRPWLNCPLSPAFIGTGCPHNSTSTSCPFHSFTQFISVASPYFVPSSTGNSTTFLLRIQSLRIIS